MILADWVVRRRGVDPGAGWRHTYSSEDESEALLAREGGIEAHVTRILDRLGIPLANSAQAGDIGLVLCPARVNGRACYAPVGSICTDRERWAVLTPDRGLVIASAERLPPLKVWRV